ncbi:hypothetical protein BGZ95_006612, partial [Linnemannia exigua]
IADGIQYLDLPRFAYSDLKPVNTLIAYDMIPKLSDLGTTGSIAPPKLFLGEQYTFIMGMTLSLGIIACMMLKGYNPKLTDEYVLNKAHGDENGGGQSL